MRFLWAVIRKGDFAMYNTPISIYALGGLGEVGKNTYCFESDRSIILVDAGVKFPSATLPGVDYVIPDYTHLKNNRGKIKALFITHGHEDHIGGIPFLVRTLVIPVIYAPRLAAALIRHKLEDARVKETVKIVEYDENSEFKIADDFLVSFFRVTHSIPDSFGICIDTPNGRIIETGDFKVDLTPVGPNFELDKLARLGSEGVDLLMADSTNAELEGYTPSETAVRAGVEEIFEKAPGRIIVSTFSSNINRIQQVMEVALEHKRKICILGRSMKNVIGIARDYGYIKIPESELIEETMLRSFKNTDICIVCTGSQGEPMAALSRIVSGDNKNTQIFPGDTVIFSSNPIPGNGALVDRLVKLLIRKKPDGGALAAGLICVTACFMPVHGEYRMLKLHGELAVQLGLPKEKVFLCDNGDVLLLQDHQITRGGRVPADDVYLDGSALDGINNAIINERSILKSDGLVTILMTIDQKNRKMVVKPIVYARGFSAAADTHVVRHSQMRAEDALNRLLPSGASYAEIKHTLRKEISAYIERKTGRHPMIVPVVMEAR